MGTKIIIAGILTLAAFVVSSATRPVGPPPVQRGYVYPPDGKIDTVLKQRLPSVRLRQASLEVAIDWLRSETGANLFVDWQALKAANIDRSSKVDVDLHDVSLAQTLDYTLRSTLQDTAALLWDVQDNVIVISSEGSTAQHGLVKIYDVRDLMESELAKQKARWDSWVKEHGPYQPSNPPLSAEPTWDELAETFKKIITDHVGEDTWRDNGGTVGTICELTGRLIIRQTWLNHLKVEALLDELREKGLPGKRPRGPATQPKGGSQ